MSLIPHIRPIVFATLSGLQVTLLLLASSELTPSRRKTPRQCRSLFKPRSSFCLMNQADLGASGNWTVRANRYCHSWIRQVIPSGRLEK